MAWVYSGAPSYGHLCNTVASLLQPGLWTVHGLWLRYGSVIIWYLSKPSLPKARLRQQNPTAITESIIAV